MTKKRKLLLGALLVLLLAGAGGGGWWWMHLHPGKGARAEAPKPGPEYRYVSLDKVLVMLRGEHGEAVSHYMAIDLVFKVLPEDEPRAKEHLPLLRTVAVKALSVHTVQSASSMSIDQVAQLLNRAYMLSYQAEGRKPPFAEALIGKLIIE